MAEPNIIITILFVVAGAANILGTLFVTKFFTNRVIFEKYPELFGREGFLCVILWGLAYISTCVSYVHTPFTVLLFALEKYFYVGTWIYFLKSSKQKISEIASESPLAGFFFGGYGLLDLAFGIFFTVVFIITLVT